MEKLISLCMIVKNEEGTLDRCLSSISQWVDEIIIVDTGSTDSTKSIGRKYTNKVYDFNWISDFSAARNHSIKYATSKWIMVLDADEYMNEKDIIELRTLLSKERPKPGLFINLTIFSFLGNKNSLTSLNEGVVVRLFPNRMGIKYFRPIHEQPMTTDNTPMVFKNFPISVYHTGYSDETMVDKNKHERNMMIFNQMKQNSVLSPYDHFMLGNQFNVGNNIEESIKHYEIALETAGKNEVWYKYCRLSAIQAYNNNRQLVKALIFWEEHLSSYAHYPDVRCIKAILLENLGFYEEAKQEFLTVIQQSELRSTNNLDISIISPNLSLRTPLWQLIRTFEREQNFPQCVYYLTKLIMADKMDLEALNKLIEILSLNESSISIIDFLDKLFDKNNQASSLTLGKTALMLGKRELAQHYIINGQLEHILKPHDLLRFALLCNDQTSFEHIIVTSPPEQLDNPLSIKHLIWGALVWEDIDLLSKLEISEKHECVMIWKHGIDILSLKPLVMDKFTEDFVFDLLSGLYTLQQVDVYDRLLEQLNTVELTNRLANWFYSKHQSSTAIQYYEILLENDLLQAEGYLSLTFMHINQQSHDDALYFSEKVINLLPTQESNYILACSICFDPQAKEIIKQKLIKLKPEYDKLAVFHAL